ncbi:DNA polymerase IV [Paenibacillus sacheonensis]|uniref:DNA polymerase IV n=1 Tax=Paenibacillus sacheonensis TaxID=742054 RepID=A0A7X4YMW9_9BACL|nr:DNA polymerase IV [Paenibacillus sacheonensis]MBM7564768.1 DNA polymerase-4 [Paenibacillus sacheonensis]NBC69320.1 DNA polymerase IV [Paenibacillus sacheonensis]
MSRHIFLIDGQSFYASVEKAAHPEYRDKPVAVGDPLRMNGIVLAACPIAKAKGVTTASRVGEAMARCPDLVVIRPRMGTYIQVSLLITEIFESYTERVEPYSIDEQFLDVTGSLAYFNNSPQELAAAIQQAVLLSTGVWSRVGIGPTKILAKMATDNYAKKSEEGVYELSYDKLESTLWTLPVHQMFMVASAMTRHFTRMGLSSIGDIARMEFGEFKRRMRREMGKQSDIQAGYYWQTARGIDPSPVEPGIRRQLKSVSHGKALRWNLYRELKDIEVVLLELVVEVCQRTRRSGFLGAVVSVAAAETDGVRSCWFSRQMTLLEPTSLTHEVAAAALKLFKEHWNGLPISRLSIALSQLTDDNVIQLTLFEDRSRAYRKERAIDAIKERYGSTAIMRASSLLEAGVARERAEQIGGHYK